MNASLHNPWIMHESDLGKSVRAVVDDLRSATLLQAPAWGDSGRGYAAPAPTQTGYTQQQQWGQQQQQQQQQQWNGGGGGGGAGPAVNGLPDIPSHFTELDSLSFDQLEALEDATNFLEFFRKLPQVQQLKQAEATAHEQNQALARANLAKQPELERAKQELLDQHAQLADRKARYEVLIKRQEELAKDLSTESIKAQLDIATRAAKDEADAIAKRFKEGTLTVAEFMKQFKTAAELHHMRRNKSESFKQTH
jgi:hypothetical protein